MAEERRATHEQNGEVKFAAEDRRESAMKRINLQRIRDHAQQLKSDLLDSMNTQLEELLDGFVSTVEQIEVGDVPDGIKGMGNNNVQEPKTAEYVFVGLSR
uniref:Uncharacterized protein n=1 Tax=Arion vulgaris TaxID=1028688 RepID=A0A0B6Y5K6_9EUPU